MISSSVVNGFISIKVKCDLQIGKFQKFLKKCVWGLTPPPPSTLLWVLSVVYLSLPALHPTQTARSPLITCISTSPPRPNSSPLLRYSPAPHLKHAQQHSYNPMQLRNMPCLHAHTGTAPLKHPCPEACGLVQRTKHAPQRQQRRTGAWHGHACD